ncbi:MAG: hypothetical protein IPL49_21940 [Saprospirales bacterium]|nr:hypothetical protein [Saprospirales bacterium]
MWWVLLLALTVGAGDMISHRLIKIGTAPPALSDGTHHGRSALAGAPGGGSSFTSNHATNHFALATFSQVPGRVFPAMAMGLFFLFGVPLGLLMPRYMSVSTIRWMWWPEAY